MSVPEPSPDRTVETDAIPPAAWREILYIATRRASPIERAPTDQPADLLGLYRGLAGCVAARPYVVAHLGQSLDGHIATENGASRFITGVADRDHNHRLRALCDAVLVGRGTVESDDPRLTVRCVDGDNPVRVVVDPDRSLGTDYQVFSAPRAPTLLLCSHERVDGAKLHGHAEVVGVDRDATGGLSPRDILRRLADRDLTAIFIEGGGDTVSRFLADRQVDRLQITVAPLILGGGRAGARVPAVADPADGMHLKARWYRLGDDMLCDSIIRPAVDRTGVTTA